MLFRGLGTSKGTFTPLSQFGQTETGTFGSFGFGFMHRIKLTKIKKNKKNHTPRPCGLWS